MSICSAEAKARSKVCDALTCPSKSACVALTSAFVAGFIGSANLLPGTAVAHDGPATIIELPLGARIRANGAQLAVGQPASVMLRTELLNPVVADPGHDARAHGGLGQWLDGLDKAVALVDVDAGIAVGQARAVGIAGRRNFGYPFGTDETC